MPRHDVQLHGVLYAVVQARYRRDIAEIFAEISRRESSQVSNRDYNHNVLPIQGLLYMLCYKAAVLSAPEVAGERAYIAQRLQARHAVHVPHMYPPALRRRVALML